MASFFPDNPRHEKAAIILSSMSTDMVDDIISLVSTYGRGVVSTITAREDSSPGAKFLAMFSNQFISNEDFADVWCGWCTLSLAEIRKVDYGNDRWEKILTDSFALPASMAAALAKRIETEDILNPGASADPSWADSLRGFSERISESIRKVLNHMATLAGTSWEIDQNQKYDADFLYEVKLLGQTVRELNSRARLMQSQIKISSGLALLQSGDPGSDPQDHADMIVGDVFSRLSLRQLPKNMFGGLGAAASIGQRASTEQAKQVLTEAGQGQSATGKARNPFLKRAIAKVLALKPGTAMAIGAGLGLAPMAIKALLSRKKGDVEEGDAYSDISANYGDSVADAWLHGDIDSVVGDALMSACEPYTTGDPALDEAIETAIMGEIGDTVEAMDPEIGGLFTRWRINAAKRRAGRRTRRGIRKAARRARKLSRTQALADARQSAVDAGTRDYDSGYSEPDAESYDDQSYEQPGDYTDSEPAQSNDTYDLGNEGYWGDPQPTQG